MQSQQNTTFHTTQKDHFIQLFPELEPLVVSNKDLENLANSMKGSKTKAPKNVSRVITNGEAIFSQFLAHDITFETESIHKLAIKIY